MKKHVLLALLILTTLILTGHTPAQAADFNVACSFTDLRDTINDTTNSNNQADTLNLASDCTYTFTENIFIQPDSGNKLTINGNGATFEGQRTYQFFDIVRPAIVEINDLTLRNGRSPAGEQGGAIINHGDLTINRSDFNNNFSESDGGAISTQGDTTLTITESIFRANRADNGSFGGGGGAIRIFDDASVTIDSTTFDRNTANGNGGAIGFAVNNNNAGSLIIRSSTFYRNRTLEGDGAAVQARLAAGVDASSLSLTVENTTISENSAGVQSQIGNGGAFYYYRESGGGAANFNFTLTNTILANNTASESGGNCFANNDGSVPVPAITSGGFNYVTDDSCTFTPVTGDQVNVPLALGALADNGGSTQTVFFASNSPVVDAGNCDTSTDQRGEPRPVDLTGVDGPGNSCDIGAVEHQLDEGDLASGTVAFDRASSSAAENAGTYNVDVVLTVEASGNATLDSPVTVAVGYSGAGAAAISGPASLTFSNTGGFVAGTYTETLQVALTDNDDDDDDRQVTIDLSNPSGATLTSPSQHILTIIDDDSITPADVPTNLYTEGRLDLAPATPTLRWVGVQGATSYRVYMQYVGGAGMVIDTTANATAICTGVVCALPTEDLLDGWGLIDINASGEDFEWWVGADGTAWSQRAAFAVDLAPAALPQVTVAPNQGRPTVTFPDDPGTAWVQFWLGPSPWGDYLAWHGRGAWVDENTPSFTCDGTTCRIDPAWDAPAGVEYTVWMQAWGPGGFSEGGPVPSAPSWTNGNTFSYPAQPAALPGVPGVDAYDGNQPVFGWESGARSTWYHLVVTTATADTVLYDNWHSAAQLACAGPGETCTLGDLGLALTAGATYKLYLQAWGPGGLTTGGDLPTAPGWVEGAFTYQP